MYPSTTGKEVKAIFLGGEKNAKGGVFLSLFPPDDKTDEQRKKKKTKARLELV